jgi:hypothetical protein
MSITIECDADELGKMLRDAIELDLSKSEDHHRRAAAEWRGKGQHGNAEHEEAIANTVRVCLVVAQVAVGRVLNINGEMP